MSEPTDPNPSDPKDDKAVSSLYARGSTEQPSNALDQAILDKARKATARDAARAHRFSGWPRAVSAAAVVVLSVLAVTLVREEAPEPLSIANRPAVVQEEKAPATPSKAPPERPAERRKAEAPAAQSNETPMALMDRLAPNKEEKDQQQRQVEEGALGKATTATPAAAPASEPMASGVARGDLQGFMPEGKLCAQMTEQECLSSAACTLSRNETAHGYQCRFAKDYCELLFRQLEGTRESCEDKTGCVYVPASCYCPPDATCECTGGKPAQCQKRQ